MLLVGAVSHITKADIIVLLPFGICTGLEVLHGPLYKVDGGEKGTIEPLFKITRGTALVVSANPRS
jgi:hypothetical protein